MTNEFTSKAHIPNLRRSVVGKLSGFKERPVGYSVTEDLNIIFVDSGYLAHKEWGVVVFSESIDELMRELEELLESVLGKYGDNGYSNHPSWDPIWAKVEQILSLIELENFGTDPN